MIENTLGPIRYLHDHFLKFGELALGFVTKCNAKGEFLVSEQVPEKGIFKESEQYLKEMREQEECKENRNEKEWISSCKNICMGFSLTSYSEVLSGYWKYYFDYVDLFKEKYELFVNPPDGQNMINPDDIVSDDMSRRRVLEGEKKEKVSDKDKFKKFLKEPIFSSTGINLINFKINFEGSGFDPTKDKDKSAITSNAYQNFQKKLQ